MNDALIERVDAIWHEEYQRIFPVGGDASDHDEAVRSAVAAVLELAAPAEWITRLTASLGELAQEHNQGAQAGVDAALDAHIRLAVRWREERDAA